jgi:lipoyl(octanoyl) transferase
MMGREPAPWRLLDGAGEALAGAANMAVDAALFEAVARGGAPTLRFYRWDPACLSLGRNQPARGLYDPAAAAVRGVDIVRRPTGGQAVYHDRELTYSVAVPVGVLGSPRATYVTINRALVAGLRRLGVAAVVAEAAPAAAGPLAAGPCFQAAAPGEVVAGGRKLVGSAQRRDGGCLLQHGSLLLDGSQSPVVELLAAAVASGAAAVAAPPPERIPSPASPLALTPPATLAELLGSVPPWTALVAALTAGFSECCGTSFAPGSLSRGEADRAAALEAHFRSAEWTWRR